MITIHTDATLAEELLSKAEYKPHWSVDDFKRPKLGYIKEIDSNTRWHAFQKEGKIQIHRDRTIRGYHTVVSNYRKDKIEKNRIKDIHKTMIVLKKKTPEPMKIKVNNRRGEFAPNLMELQRNHKTALNIVPATQKLSPTRLLTFISKLINLLHRTGKQKQR